MLRFSPGLTRWQKGGRGREEGQGRWWCFSNEDDFMTWYTVRMLHLWNETMKMIVWHDKPLQVPEDLQKLKKTLSDKTKRKIAENNRKFSICKLCRWDLASFFFYLCNFQQAMPRLPRSGGSHAPRPQRLQALAVFPLLHQDCIRQDLVQVMIVDCEVISFSPATNLNKFPLRPYKTFFQYIPGISNRDMVFLNARAQGMIQTNEYTINQNLISNLFRCGKTYSRAQSMLFHVNKHEENEMNFFQCNHCQSRFKKKEKLENHIQKKHSGGFECETCGKKFPEQSSLKEHGRVWREFDKIEF